MTYATLSASSSEKTAARQYLNADQELALVAQVKERTELLKLKKDSFTLDEQRIRIKGERAFNTLIDEYRGLGAKAGTNFSENLSPRWIP